ncbi:Response regulator containing a CheY-like receiver domain and a GGDEF domain [Hahella chejuensis KCTC 2396]|uniref:Response regulator containing a CheY-like receiver domain and a GGDEF domain n=1 Tax=Hahella chejuensis (strain KCTC 2396) TaxID=349521 RepID=Q2SB53_HAHCH|nr:response regulator [Hahella chejuensis]ABC32121.1 Response regulator containing a CheY-like receiver domain and a GGDEF domain [Hahella chejuensis KCTC 2396]
MHEQILAIDDDERNLRLIRAYLADTGYDLITAADGEEGWGTLERHLFKVDLILLDRMMPKMDGIAFLQRLKEHPSAKDIPVIMQTAAAESGQIREGIDAGAYYYLTKPYEEEVLISIIKAALEFGKESHKLMMELGKNKSLRHMARQLTLSFATVEEAEQASILLADLFPFPPKVVTGLAELLVNAVEHGNLGITYDEKTDLNLQGEWMNEVQRRQKLPENQNKRVQVEFARTDDAITIAITDQGPGFNWREYLQISVERATDNHGRGIAMANLLSFDEMTYEGDGNRVVCKVLL